MFSQVSLIRDHLQKSLKEVESRVKEKGLKRYAFELRPIRDGVLEIEQNYLALDLVELVKRAVRASFTRAVGGFVKENGRWTADIRPEGKRVGQIVIISVSDLETKVRVQ